MSHGFSFTDPFALFDEIFGQEFPEWRHRRSHFHGHPRFMEFDPFFSPFSNPLSRTPVGLGGLLASMERDMFGLSGGFPSHARSFPSLEPPRHRRERGFLQESYMTQTINGVTQSVHKRKDMDVSPSYRMTFSSFWLPHSGKRTCHSHLPRWPPSVYYQWCRATGSWLSAIRFQRSQACIN